MPRPTPRSAGAVRFPLRRGVMALASCLFLGAATLAFAQDGGVLQKAQIMADKGWVLVGAAMVFLMQVGFLFLEVGMVRPKSATITALKNTVDWLVCAATFFFIGWGLMFGHTKGGIFGGDFLGSFNGDTSGGHPIGIWVHFLFQLAFAGTAATIVSGALAERCSFYAYMITSLVTTALIYPVAGHWTWGNSFFTTQHSWLTALGFIDFAGSTQVHSIGGWISLVGITIIGPRLGRFDVNGTVREWDSTGLNWSAVGVLLLWFSWWAFNGASTLALNDQVGPIINNTNIAASFGGIGAILYTRFAKQSKGITVNFLGGILAGLVGITANCHMVSPLSAVFIGLSSGVIMCLFSDLLLKLKLDDPVGATPVHLACGIWGTLCVAIFGDAGYLTDGKWPAGGRFQQIGVQLLGIGAVAFWTITVAFVTFWATKQYFGLRVSPEEEQFGFDIAGVTQRHGEDAMPSEEELKKLIT